jgi:flagellar biosynthetic protein FlhB
VADTDDRTEAATPRRLQRAREEGNVPLSPEAPALAGLAACALLAMLAGPGLVQHLAGRLATVLAQAHTLDPAAALRATLLAGAALALPFVLAALLAGVLAVLLQTGFLLSLQPMLPDLARLSPMRGLNRLLGRQALLQAALALLKFGLVAAVTWRVLGTIWPLLPGTLLWEPATLLGQASRQVLRLILVMLGAQTVLVLLDVLRVRLQHAAGLRMSRHDVREEHRESEGDPLIKARIRRIRLQRARRRMLQAVRKATVVVTNPTHYAVALVYDRSFGTAAPRVVAKGVDAMAARIRAIAEEHRVPLVANPPLARALWRVELDEEIPPDLFQAVAEVIAYVWRLRSGVRPSGL